MALIRPGLYIGGRDDVEKFRARLSDESNRVLRILTVDVEPVRLPEMSAGVVTKFVNCLDEPEADLLSSLDECVHFITQGLEGCEGCEAVLVHW